MNNTDKNIINFHYYFNDPNLHEIDAATLLRAEKAFVDYVQHFARQTGIKIDLTIAPKEKGGLQDWFFAVVNSPAFETSGTVLISIVVSKFISPTPKLPKEERELKRAEIIDKIKSGRYTEIDIDTIIDGDRKMKKYKNEYFKTLRADSSISKLGTSINDGQEAMIPRKEFDKRISDDETENEMDEDAEILIYSLVIDGHSRKMWSGVYDGEMIYFAMNDTKFKREVQGGGIEIKENLVLTCILKIQERDFSESPNYSVEKVKKYQIDDNAPIRFYHKTDIPENQMDIEQLFPNSMG